MRDYAKVSPQFWVGNTGRQIRQLGREAQLIALYLLTCPHATMLGIYYLPIAYIAHDTGIPIEGASKALQSLCEVNFCAYDTHSEFIWVYNMAQFQIGRQLDIKDKRVKGVNEQYLTLPNLPFLKDFYEKYCNAFHLETVRPLTKKFSPLEAPSKPLASQEQEQEQEVREIPNGISMSGTPDDVPFLDENNFSQDDTHSAPRTSATAILKTQALEVLQFLNEKTGRAYRPVATNLTLITARLRSGATVMDCRQVIAKKTREWKGNPEMINYLRPATLFNATKFEQYLGELPPDEEDAP